jgi:prepilin-type N-terminal cleavage/methylation domain-containing protein
LAGSITAFLHVNLQASLEREPSRLRELAQRRCHPLPSRARPASSIRVMWREIAWHVACLEAALDRSGCVLQRAHRRIMQRGTEHQRTARKPCLRRPACGFTLPEIMVSVAIIGILAVITGPSVAAFMRSRASTSAVDQIAAHLRLARSYAVLEGNDYLVRFLDDHNYVIVDDDGGGGGMPGAEGYVASNRNNGAADSGENQLGPFELPEGMAFDAATNAVNPFTNTSITSAVTFPPLNGKPVARFRANGTTSVTGYIAVSPSVVEGSTIVRTTVLQVLRTTGSVASRPVS